MVKSHRNDVASVVLDRSTDGGNGFKLCSTFTGGSFRHKIIDTMCCGGGSGGAVTSPSDKPKQKVPEKRPECKSDSKKNGGSKRLPESRNKNEEEKVKKKVLEEMRRVVKKLQCDDVLWGSKEVRRLTKEASEARTTLANQFALFFTDPFTYTTFFTTPITTFQSHH